MAIRELPSIFLHENPSPEEILGLTQKASEGKLRGILSGDNIFVWPGFSGTHFGVWYELWKSGFVPGKRLEPSGKTDYQGAIQFSIIQNRILSVTPFNDGVWLKPDQWPERLIELDRRIKRVQARQGAGMSESILVEMSTPEALRVFQQHGIDAQKMTPEELRLAYRRLIMQNHPDRGGDLETAKAINVAFDTLKNGIPQYRDSGSRSHWGGARYRPQREPEQDEDQYPIWAQAGYSGGMKETGNIYRNNYTDLNFIRKKLWELNGKKTDQAWTVRGHDGSYFRNIFTVWGSRATFPDMAQAMYQWQSQGASSYNVEFIFASPRGQYNTLFLIFARGKNLGKTPMVFDMDEIGDPELSQQANDRKLIQAVQKRLGLNESVLTEMPMRSVSLIGNFNRSHGFRHEDDRKALNNPKMIEKLVKKFAGTQHDFVTYFVNIPGSARSSLRGRTSLEQLSNYLPRKAVKQIQADASAGKLENAITFVYGSNRSNQRFPMTSWIIAHRMWHAINDRIGNPYRHDPIIEEQHRIEKDFQTNVADEILRDAYQVRLPGPITSKSGISDHGDGAYIRPGSPSFAIYKKFYEAIGRSRAARTGQLANPQELFPDLLAEYLFTGSIRFNQLPQSLDLGRGRGIYQLDPESDNWADQLLERAAGSLEMEFDMLLSACTGSIFLV